MLCLERNETRRGNLAVEGVARARRGCSLDGGREEEFRWAGGEGSKLRRGGGTLLPKGLIRGKKKEEGKKKKGGKEERKGGRGMGGLATLGAERTKGNV